jgi:Trk-type K+ transport system membrane component
MRMKFALAIFVYLLIALVLGAGILLLLAGKPWLFIAAVVGFIVAFGRIGCMSH